MDRFPTLTIMRKVARALAVTDPAYHALMAQRAAARQRVVAAVTAFEDGLAAACTYADQEDGFPGPMYGTVVRRRDVPTVFAG